VSDLYDGNVAVAGLHEGAAAPLDRGSQWVRAESRTVAQRLWAKPAVTVIGIDILG
jgi:hypothetical protein